MILEFRSRCHLIPEAIPSILEYSKSMTADLSFYYYIKAKLNIKFKEFVKYRERHECGVCENGFPTSSQEIDHFYEVSYTVFFKLNGVKNYIFVTLKNQLNLANAPRISIPMLFDSRDHSSYFGTLNVI